MKIVQEQSVKLATLKEIVRRLMNDLAQVLCIQIWSICDAILLSQKEMFDHAKYHGTEQ